MSEQQPEFPIKISEDKKTARVALSEPLYLTTDQIEAAQIHLARARDEMLPAAAEVERDPIRPCHVRFIGNDILEIYGRRFSGELLRTLVVPTPPGRWLRIVSTDNGVITVHERTDLIIPGAQ